MWGEGAGAGAGVRPLGSRFLDANSKTNIRRLGLPGRGEAGEGTGLIIRCIISRLGLREREGEGLGGWEWAAGAVEVVKAAGAVRVAEAAGAVTEGKGYCEGKGRGLVWGSDL